MMPSTWCKTETLHWCINIRNVKTLKHATPDLESLCERKFWWILLVFHGFLPRRDLWGKNGSYANGMHSMEEKFPTSQVWKGLSLPMPGPLKGPFLLSLKVYEVEQTNCKGNQALSAQAFSLKPRTHNGSFKHSATQTPIKNIAAQLLKLTLGLNLLLYAGRAPLYRLMLSANH